MKSKALQYFSVERLKLDANLPKEEIAKFLDEFQSVVHGNEGKRKLISLRVPEKLLDLFKKKAKRSEISYQTQIVTLMREWVAGQIREKPSALALNRIVSGGQTGVDRAALDIGLMFKIPCGGWCPKGRLAEDGVIDERYPMTETVSEQYEQRTEWNVRDSDGTLVLAWGPLTEGTLFTAKIAKKYKKPLLCVDLKKDPDSSVELARKWIREQGTAVLNVAGPRASQNREIYPEAYKFLFNVFRT
ncbi:MAG: putative molybdenum carrier protein [Bdellovibrionota bacterium]